MSSNERHLYRENHTKRVKYDTAWIDPTFSDWLDAIYGSQKSPLDHWASVVSLEPADGVAKSLSTGGRVFVYKLKRPYLDPVSGLPCYQIDVKGVGLTKSGYLQDRDRLEPSQSRRELMWQHWQEIYFGYENLSRQKEVVRDLRGIRAKGHGGPVPLAILNLKQMVYEGRTRSIVQLRKILEIDWDENFALLIRGYPVTATRICDLTQWDKHTTPQHIPYQTVKTINWARRTWSKHELPKFLAASKGRFDLEPGRSYFDWFLRTALRELTLMLTTGLSPTTGYETMDHGYHTHLQNYTTANTHVEWTPLTHINDASHHGNQRMRHLYELIEAEHDALVNIGACSLNAEDFYLIPNFLDFLTLLTYQLRNKVSYLTPDIENQMGLSPGGLNGRGDNLLRFLENRKAQFDSVY